MNILTILLKFIKREQQFVCGSCEQQRAITERVCIDPSLCSICVEIDNNREYLLTFGRK